MTRGAASVIRRRIPIIAYVGSNGGGKTLCMVNDTLKTLESSRRRKVISTVRILDDNGNPHPNYEPLQDWRQVLDARDADVLLDEVSGVAEARQFAALPTQLLTRMTQLRKAGVVIRWTSPNFSRADVVLREVTKAVTLCKGYLREYERDEDGEILDPFGSARLFRWVTYPSEDFDTFEAGATDKLKAVCRQWAWRGPNMLAANRYDTHEECLQLSHLDLTGTCITCGGHRAKPKCACPRPDMPVYEPSTDLDVEPEPDTFVAITTKAGTEVRPIYTGRTGPGLPPTLAPSPIVAPWAATISPT